MSAHPYTPEERAGVSALLEEFGRAAGNGGADRSLQFLIIEVCRRLEATVVEVSLERDSKHNAMKYAAERADGLDDKLRAVHQEALRIMDGFASTAEAAVAHSEWMAGPRTGMRVPFHGDFASAYQIPSVISRLRWWAREFRASVAKIDAEMGNTPPATHLTAGPMSTHGTATEVKINPPESSKSEEPTREGMLWDCVEAIRGLLSGIDGEFFDGSTAFARKVADKVAVELGIETPPRTS